MNLLGHVLLHSRVSVVIKCAEDKVLYSVDELRLHRSVSVYRVLFEVEIKIHEWQQDIALFHK